MESIVSEHDIGKIKAANQHRRDQSPRAKMDALIEKWGVEGAYFLDYDADEVVVLEFDKEQRTVTAALNEEKMQRMLEETAAVASEELSKEMQLFFREEGVFVSFESTSITVTLDEILDNTGFGDIPKEDLEEFKAAYAKIFKKLISP